MSINQRIKDKVSKDGAKAVKKWNDRFQKNKRKLEEEKQDKKDIDK